MSPPPQPQLTVLTYAETTTPTTMFTPPTIIALVLLAILTIILLGALLVFLFHRARHQPGSGPQEDTFLDLEAGSQKSPYFEVVDGSARSSPSAWTGVNGSSGSKSLGTGPEQPWPVHTVPTQPRPRAFHMYRMLKTLAFWRCQTKCDPSTPVDVLHTKEVLDVEDGVHPRSPPWTWRTVLSLFRRKLPEIVIHLSDGSPPFVYVEDLDSTPASVRARRLLEQCEAVAFSADDCDFGAVSSASPDGGPTSFMVLSDSCASSFQECGYPEATTLMRPSTPLGMAPTDEPARSFAHVSISDPADLRSPRALTTCNSVLDGAPRDCLALEADSQSTMDDTRPTVLIAPSQSSPDGNAASEDDKSTPSNSSSESSVADIISILEEISADSSGSSDSLSLKTSLSDDSMALQPSRKRFSGVFDTIKRVSLQLSDVDLNPDGAFGRSTYYGVLGEYHVRRVRDSIASGDTL